MDDFILEDDLDADVAVQCDSCQGSGFTIEGWDCPNCDGSGYLDY